MKKTSIFQHKKGFLQLEDGSQFEGYFFGSERAVSGEVVFNTGMTGYPETLTDPSYQGQILVLTYPIVGNYGVPGDVLEDGISLVFESDAIHVRALVIADLCTAPSHARSERTLDLWLTEHDVPGLYGIDTRALTKKLREKGVMKGSIVPAGAPEMPFLEEGNPVAEVSCKERKVYQRGKKRVLLVDCGAKNRIITNFLDRNVTVIRVPWDHDFLKEAYDGLFISNGPGDPKECVATIAHLKKALEGTKPIFGICLGNQLLALAAGGDTYKLKYGHRGQNQPCIEVGTKRCYITSQNHGYAVDEKTLPKGWTPWFRNNNDGTNEGIRHEKLPFFSVQFHPEAAPGPMDTEFLFDKFISLL